MSVSKNKKAHPVLSEQDGHAMVDCQQAEMMVCSYFMTALVSLQVLPQIDELLCVDEVACSLDRDQRPPLYG